MNKTERLPAAGFVLTHPQTGSAQLIQELPQKNQIKFIFIKPINKINSKIKRGHQTNNKRVK